MQFFLCFVEFNFSSFCQTELIPVNRPASFHISVSNGGAAELAVSVRGPQAELPVRVTGDVHAGFTAEFTPTVVSSIVYVHSLFQKYETFL